MSVAIWLKSPYLLKTSWLTLRSDLGSGKPSLQASTTGGSPVSHPPVVAMGYCTRCHSRIDADWVYCYTCGTQCAWGNQRSGEQEIDWAWTWSRGWFRLSNVSPPPPPQPIDGPRPDVPPTPPGPSRSGRSDGKGKSGSGEPFQLRWQQDILQPKMRWHIFANPRESNGSATLTAQHILIVLRGSQW